MAKGLGKILVPPRLADVLEDWERRALQAISHDEELPPIDPAVLDNEQLGTLAYNMRGCFRTARARRQFCKWLVQMIATAQDYFRDKKKLPGKSEDWLPTEFNEWPLDVQEEATKRILWITEVMLERRSGRG